MGCPSKEKFSERILKEYSLLYIIINKLSLFLQRIEIISNVSFSQEFVNDFKSKLVDNLASGKIYDKLTFDKFFTNSKFSNFLSDINEFAPVQLIISKKVKKKFFHFLMIFWMN